MVREVLVTEDIPSCSVETLWTTVFEDPAVFRLYHAEANGDPDADVGIWSGGQRTVSFCTPLQAPAIVKKSLGLESVRVREVSTAVRQSDGSIRVTSEPVLDFPGGSKFSTSAVTCILPDGAGGCKMVATVRCTAAGPWGMQGMIEDIMATQASQTLQVFLLFCKKRCLMGAPMYDIPLQTAIAETPIAAEAAAVAPARVSVPAAVALLPEAQAASAAQAEAFYDAVTGVPVLLTRFKTEPGTYADPALLCYLDTLTSAVQSTADEAQLMRERLANLEADVAELLRSRRLVLPVGQQSWPSFWITAMLLASTSISFAAVFALRFKVASSSGK